MVGKMGHIRHTSRARDEGVLLPRARFPFVPPTAGVSLSCRHQLCVAVSQARRR